MRGASFSNLSFLLLMIWNITFLPFHFMFYDDPTTKGLGFKKILTDPISFGILNKNILQPFIFIWARSDF